MGRGISDEGTALGLAYELMQEERKLSIGETSERRTKLINALGAIRADSSRIIVALEKKASAWQARAVDAERRAMHAVGRAKRMGVGFGNVKGGA